MTTDLWMLLASAALTWVLIMLVAFGQLFDNGLAWGLGNHEEIPPMGGWLARAKRASNNMNENLALFAIVVIVVHLAGKANETTALWSQIYVLARVGHALVYIAGLTVIRTVVFLVSILAVFMITSALF
ncbi:MAPEG family protein [Paraliomyxa miuraensis]|uniref:MAPEG family protein n=1 Tax=Paraliomyxa miuraensis TaxID=376150 RepID=UPI00225BB622|nr:MAPEG family protein [Paraliomyxa miuraensis]MCX4244330.1 MAPEG family protein [Paraliomyxa miuraensis]